MQGRLENKIKREKVIENLLKDMPQYVTEYYYNLSSSPILIKPSSVTII